MDTVTVEISAVVAGGDGLARDSEGRVTFVSGALPAERVTAEVHQRRKDFAKATVLEVLDPSPLRIAPPCRFVAEGCGGCDWQHVSPAGQRQLKADIVADALRRQAKLDIDVALGPELAASAYRTTVRGVAVDGHFGFMRRGTHDPIPVGDCSVAHPLLDELVRDGRFPDGEVVLRAGARTAERLAIVRGDRAQARLPDDVRLVTRGDLRSRTRAWYHEEAAGRRWRISADSFFQVRPDGAEALVDVLRGALGGGLQTGSHLIDLYGGVGLFAGTLGGEAGHVTLVESAGSSVADARVNLADISAKVIKADVARWRPARADAVVADPPRAGLGREGVAAVAATHAPRVALVSCDPASLGRDTRLLLEAGYELRAATLVDLFPQTSHVEVVSRFERA